MAAAQPTGYLQGTVVDDSTGAGVPYASILVEDTFLGTAADEDGEYVLRLPTGAQVITAQAVGYSSSDRQVTIAAGDTATLDFRLPPRQLQLGRITVESEAPRESPNVFHLTPESIQSAPSLGEPDVIRSAARLPGITQANDTKASLNVWGGASDQNLYLLDGIPVFSPGHVGGVFSAFNPKALGGVDIFAGHFPARYGGRLSSVVALETKSRPDTSLARAHVSILSVSAGTAKQFGETFVTAAARRTYFDPLMIAARMNDRYNFHDANLKITHEFSEGLAVDAIGFTNRDFLASGVSRHRDEPDLQLDWGNYLGALRLRRSTARLDNRLTASAVQKWIGGDHRSGGFVENRLLDLRLAYNGAWRWSNLHIGYGATYRQLQLRQTWKDEGLRLEDYFGINLPVQHTLRDEDPLFSGYLAVQQSLAHRLDLETGLRYSSLGSIESGDLAPRLRISYEVTDEATVSAAAGRYVQYIAGARTGLGTGPEEFEIADGLPLFLLERPERVRTYSLAADLKLSPAYRLRVVGYYRRFSRLARLQAGGEVSFPSFRYGEGRAYGATVFIEKSRGWITLQGGYALSVPTVNMGKGWHAAGWSIPHALKGMIGFHLGPWQLSLAGRYRSGLPYTPATGRFTSLGNNWNVSFVDGEPGYLEEYAIPGMRNSRRLPSYGRVDIALRRRYENRVLTWELYVQAINALNTANVIDMHRSEFYRRYFSNSAGIDYSGGLATSIPIIPTIGAHITIK